MLLRKLQLGSLGRHRPGFATATSDQHVVRPSHHRLVQCQARRGRKKASEEGPEDLFSEAELTQQALEQAAREREAQLAAERQVSEEDATNENSPKRYPYHKRLLAYAQQGSVEDAEGVLREMERAGLLPGPRAYHALLFAAIKAGDVDGALAVAQEAASKELELLPESYKALMFAFINQDEPDVESALGVYESMQEQSPEGAEEGWLLLCKQLFFKGLDDSGMQLVQEGREAGYRPDSDLYVHIIRNLCAADLKEQAYAELQTMSEAGMDLLPVHYNWIIRQEAMDGRPETAESLLNKFFKDARAIKPDVTSYNALIEGLVSTLGPASTDADANYKVFKYLREGMYSKGLRPNRYTHMHTCCGYIRMKDADSALMAFSAMRDAAGAGGSRLLDRQHLASLLVLLSTMNRPVDLLNTLNDMASDMCYIPGAALAPNPAGLSIVGEWVPQHYEVMKQRGSGQFVEDQGEEEDSKSAIRTIEDELVGLGDCIVDADGVIIPPNKLTAGQVQVEAKLRGLNVGLKTRELKTLIRDARERLPKTVKDHYKRLREARKAKQEAGSSDKKPAKEKVETRYGYYRRFDKGILLETGPIVRTFKAGTQERTVGGAEEELADLELPTGDEDDDDLALTITGGVEEGVKDIIEGEDPDTWLEAGAGEEEEGEEGILSLVAERNAELDNETLYNDHYNASKLNPVAGMAIAMDVLKAVEMLGGQPSGQDLLVLVQGAIHERSAAACVELAQRGRLIAAPGVDLSEVFEDLATTCLNSGAILQADLIVQQAEVFNITLDEQVVERIAAATGGRRQQLISDELTTQEVDGALQALPDDAVADEDDESSRAGLRVTSMDEVIPERRELVWEVAAAEAAARSEAELSEAEEEEEEQEEEAGSFAPAGSGSGGAPYAELLQHNLKLHLDRLVADIGEQNLLELGPEFLETVMERTMVEDPDLAALLVAAQEEELGPERMAEQVEELVAEEPASEEEAEAQEAVKAELAAEDDDDEVELTEDEQKRAELLQSRLEAHYKVLDENDGEVPDGYVMDAEKLLEGVFDDDGDDGGEIDLFDGSVLHEAVDSVAAEIEELRQALGLDDDDGDEPPQEMVDWVNSFGDADDDEEGVFVEEVREAASGARR